MVDNLKVSKFDSDDGSNGYEKMEESGVGDRGRLGSTWIHGEPAQFLLEMLTLDSNVGDWINPTAEFLVALMLVDLPFLVLQLESLFFGLPFSVSQKMYGKTPSSFLAGERAYDITPLRYEQLNK